MVTGEGATEGTRRATGVAPSPGKMKGGYHECESDNKAKEAISKPGEKVPNIFGNPIAELRSRRDFAA